MAAPEATLRSPGDGTAAMVGGSVVAAVAAYLFLQGGARLLGAERFAPLSALWTIQFLVMAVALLPLEQLTIRLRSLESRAGVYRIAVLVTGASAVTAAAYAAANVDDLFAGETVYVYLSALSVVTMAVFAVERGELAGRVRYREYGWATGGQAVLRLAAGLSLIAIFDGAVGGGWAMVLSPLIVLLWWQRRITARSAAATGAGSFVGGVLAANAAAQIVLVSGPLVVERLGGTPAAVSVLFVTLTLFRAPLAVANNTLARLLPPFAQLATAGRTARLRSWSLRLPAIGAGAAGIAVLGAAWLGPGLTAGLFGTDFRPSAATAALVAGGSVLATAGAFANQILIALGATWRLAAAWTLGLTAAIVTLAVSGADPVARVAAGFFVGEATAVLAVGGLAYARLRS